MAGQPSGRNPYGQRGRADRLARRQATTHLVGSLERAGSLRAGAKTRRGASLTRGRYGACVRIAAMAVAALVGIVTAVASAARPAITFVPPSPGEGDDADDNSVTFAFTYTKKPKATQTLTCTLSGRPPPRGRAMRALLPVRKDRGRASPTRPRQRLVHVLGGADPDRWWDGVGDAALHGCPAGRRERDLRGLLPHLRADECGRSQVLGLERLRPARERDDHG